MPEPHLCALRPHKTGAPPGAPTSGAVAPSARRQREAQVTSAISGWFTAQRVAVVHSVGSGRVVEVTYDIAPPYNEPLPLVHPSFSVTVTLTPDDTVWRPRVSKLLWDASLPYFGMFRWLRAAFRSNRNSAADNACEGGALAVDPSTKHACAKAGQSLERALTAVYHGIALEENKQLVVPEATTRTVAAHEGRKRRRVHSATTSLAEHIAREKRLLELKLANACAYSGGPPGFHTADAQQAIVRAYVVTRLGMPHRGSQVDNAPMLIACAIRVMMPHVAPLATSALMAERVASQLHAHVRSSQDRHYSAMQQRARAILAHK